MKRFFSRFSSIQVLSTLAAATIFAALYLFCIGLDAFESAASHRIPPAMSWSDYVLAADAGEVRAILVHGEISTIELADGGSALVTGYLPNLDDMARKGIRIEMNAPSPATPRLVDACLGVFFIVLAITLLLQVTRNLIKAVRRIEEKKRNAAAQPKAPPLSEQQLQRTAIHEAGHALLAHGYGFVIQHAKIDPEKGGGVVRYEPGSATDLDNYGAIISTSMAGHLAEIVVTGTPTSGSNADLKKVAELVRSMVREHGMGNRTEGLPVADNGPSSLIEMAENDEAEIMLSARRHCREVLETHTNAIRALAVALLDRNTLAGEEVAKILNTYLPHGALAKSAVIKR